MTDILVYNNDEWVGYESVDTLKMKVDYATKECLGGVVVW